MKNVLLLGAGMVAGPVVEYLGRNFRVHVAAMAMDGSTARAVDASDNVFFHKWDMDDRATMDGHIRDADLVISLLPAWFHADVAKACIRHEKNMVTASYVSPAMRELDREARQKGILLLNEIGVDPGIDHMSAMRVIRDAADKGNAITSFKSYTGGLPAPDSNTNPWGYKLSWSPRSVVQAAANSAHYLWEGREIRVTPDELFTDTHELVFDDPGTLTAYPNRDSYPYLDLYGLHGVDTMYRGTLRYPGWCELWHAIGRLGLLSNRIDPSGMTHGDLVLALTGNNGDPRQAAATFLGLPHNHEVLEKLAWIGLFDSRRIPSDTRDTMQVLADLMGEKLAYEPGERDMIVMRHEFGIREKGRDFILQSTMIHYGDPNGFTAMAKTVGLPVAIAAKLVLDGKIGLTGVQIPITPEIYEQVLPELEMSGIGFDEKIVEI